MSQPGLLTWLRTVRQPVDLTFVVRNGLFSSLVVAQMKKQFPVCVFICCASFSCLEERGGQCGSCSRGVPRSPLCCPLAWERQMPE